MIIQYPKKNIYKNNSFEKKKYTNDEEYAVAMADLERIGEALCQK